MARRRRALHRTITDKVGVSDVPTNMHAVIGGGTPVTPPVNDWTLNGIPPAGQCIGGVGVTGRSRTDLTNAESYTGEQAGMWRLYYGAADYANAASYAASDCAWAHSQGLIPWISFKRSSSVTAAQVAAGAVDTWAQGIAAAMGAADGPVWMCFQHEYENDSGATEANYIAMQNRILPFFKAYDNIATSIILMGMRETSWNDASEDWSSWMPDPSLVDIYGIDPYNWYGVADMGGTTDSNWAEMGPKYIDELEAWMAARPTWSHMRMAIAECGYTDVASQYADPPGTTGSGADWLVRAWDSLKAANGAAMTYFNLNAGDIGESVDRTWKCDDATKGPRLAYTFAQGAQYPF